MGAFNFGDSRKWSKSVDELPNRAVTERAVTAKEQFDGNRDGSAQVDAVPKARPRADN